MEYIDLGKISILINTSITSGYSYFSYYVPVGMCSDCNYVSGISHLTEHVITDLLYDFAVNKWQLMNAYVKKDYTCFHGQVLDDSFCELLNLFLDFSSCYDNDFKEDRISYEKERIIIENEKALSNERLLDYLYLEQVIYDDSRKCTTLLCQEDFLKIQQKDIYNFIDEEYKNVKHLVVISTSPQNYNILIQQLKTFPMSVKTINLSYKKYFTKNNQLCQTARSKTYHTTCIEFGTICSIKDYCIIKAVIWLYNLVLITGVLSDTTLVDISVAYQYRSTLLFFTCERELTNVMPVLQSLPIENYEMLFSDLIKKVMFGNLKSFSDPRTYNDFVFKMLYYYNILFDIKEMICCYQSITFNELVECHNQIVNGRVYIS